ncbi:SsgA family sporulation/cell division regulator [Streptomyces sp. NPDC057428]|uniref:SsgA family sporulation/cell division regulator n=1 Tax=Streptomyces sp. NPDC057428 TaxID=3346129 RepID=UPI0036C363EC
MSGNRPGVRAHQAPPQELPLLSLDIRCMLDAFAWHTMKGEFRFDTRAPLVVSLTFLVEGAPRITWSVGRDLLYQGLFWMSGLGDVQVWPAYLGERATAWLQLDSYDVTTLFELPITPLAAWLEHSYELVPAGAEVEGLDWDDVISGLLRTPKAPPDD